MAALINELGELMSAVSEECYCAGWISSMDRELPLLCDRAVKEQRAQNWGQSQVTVEQATKLLDLVHTVGGWATLNSDLSSDDYVIAES